MSEAGATILIVMGVSGSGKTTVAALLAGRLGWRFADGDDFHSAANVAKMRSGEPLDDADRQPWLDALAAEIDRWRREGASGVLACSALKRRYRDFLVDYRPGLHLVYLKGEPELIAHRLAARHGHFMPPALLESQFAALEEPGSDERPIVVSIADSPPLQVEKILAALGRAAASEGA